MNYFAAAGLVLTDFLSTFNVALVMAFGRCADPGSISGVAGSSSGCAIALGLVIGDLGRHHGQPDWRLVPAVSMSTGG